MVIFINQLRMKIGVMFGNPETTTGGNALKFYASVRLDIRRIGAIKKGDEVISVAAGFPTTVNPIFQNNAVPVFVDVKEDFKSLQLIAKEHNTIIPPLMKSYYNASNSLKVFDPALIAKYSNLNLFKYSFSLSCSKAGNPVIEIIGEITSPKP